MSQADLPWWRPVPPVEGPLTVGHQPTPDRYRWMVESVQEVIFEADPTGAWTYLNPAWERLLGYSVADCIGRNFLEFVHPDDRQPNLDVFIDVVTSGKEKCRFSARYLKADGELLHLEIHAWIFRDAQGNPLGSTGTLMDITERVHSEELLREQATHDSLTGLPNRVLLAQHLAEAVQRCNDAGQPLGVVLLDLDRFKLVNDSLGHDVGDEVLRTVGLRLRRAMRGRDFVARFGGDEFVLVSEGLADAQIKARVQRLRSAVAAPMDIGERRLTLSFSAGIRVLQPHEAHRADLSSIPHDLLRDADVAMYGAKEGGRDRSRMFDAGLRLITVGRLDTENDLRHAVERAELSLALQPQVDLTSGALCGYEALLRWDHPQRGLLLPDSFIAVAEDTGLIVPLGRWVIAEACRLLAEHSVERIPRLSINVSAHQLASGLVADVSSALADHGVDAERLCVELTETALLADVDRARASLGALSDLGVRVSLDDFGTGYSSLGQLQRLPIAELKVDRSFVAQISSAAGRGVVAAIIGVADALGIDTVAEGVERPAEAAALGELGCEYAQGYLFGRPMPAPMVERTIPAARVGSDSVSRRAATT